MAQKTEKEETEFHVPETTLSSCISSSTATVTSSSSPTSSPSDPPAETPSQSSAVAPEEKSKSRSSEEGEEGRREVKKRCSGCKRKVGLTGFRCRCGDLFCWEHRYSDRHDCSFDYKAAGRDAIARQNPLVKAPKILKV